MQRPVFQDGRNDSIRRLEGEVEGCTERLITGASSGIPGPHARGIWINRGIWVWAGVRSKADGERLVRAASARLRVVTLDVTDPTSVAEAGRAICEGTSESGLAGLVMNNAGISVAGPLELLPLLPRCTQFEVNVIGALAVTQVLLPVVATGARSHREHQFDCRRGGHAVSEPIADRNLRWRR